MHKDAKSYIKQILETTSQKTAAVRPLITNLESHPNLANKTCWTLLTDLGRTHNRRVGRSSRTYQQQLCTDTGFSQEDLLEAMNDRDR